MARVSRRKSASPARNSVVRNPIARCRCPIAHRCVEFDRLPFPGVLGQRVLKDIAKDMWAQWKDHSVLLINRYGLNLADPEAKQFWRRR